MDLHTGPAHEEPLPLGALGSGRQTRLLRAVEAEGTEPAIQYHFP